MKTNEQWIAEFDKQFMAQYTTGKHLSNIATGAEIKAFISNLLSSHTSALIDKLESLKTYCHPNNFMRGCVKCEAQHQRNAIIHQSIDAISEVKELNK